MRRGGARSVMCAYTSLNGVPSCANRGLLTSTLRQQWCVGCMGRPLERRVGPFPPFHPSLPQPCGCPAPRNFTGFVVSDCSAIRHIFDVAHLSHSPEGAAAAALRAGTDMACRNKRCAAAWGVMPRNGPPL